MVRGFTLIELLIVISIILVLIAIALPNFLQAQVRARVTKARSDIRVLATAVDRYGMDWGIYPGRSLQNYRARNIATAGLLRLVDPIPYITSLPDDPFPLAFDIHTQEESRGPFTYWMTGVDNAPGEELLHPHGGYFLRAWVVFSAGPDAPLFEVDPEKGCMALNSGFPSYFSYSPTNGVGSKGDIWLFGGEPEWMGYDVTDRGCMGFRRGLTDERRRWVWYDDIPLVGRFPLGFTL
jgi:type II secretion system protein G